jgi:hypothetical protein
VYLICVLCSLFFALCAQVLIFRVFSVHVLLCNFSIAHV